MSAPSAAAFDKTSVTLTSGSNALTVTNTLTAPGAANLIVSKAYAGDTNPSKVTTQPSVTVTATCSISGAKTVTFTPPATGSISGVVGDVCNTFAETAATGAVFAGGYSMSAASSAAFSAASVTLAASAKSLTVTNALTPPGAATLTVSKAYAGDTNPSKVTTQPSITVTATCSISGAKTATFTPPATGSISGVVGDVCNTFAETAATGAVLASGYSMSAVSAATFSAASVTLAASANALTVTNTLTAPGAANLIVSKAYAGDTNPSKVTTQPSITVTATCSISGAKTVTFTPPAAGSITGVIGDVCNTFAETAATGAVLAGGYTMSAASAATFSAASITLAAGSNALTVTNALTASPNVRSIITPLASVPQLGGTVSISVRFINDGPVDALNVIRTLQMAPNLQGVVVSDGGSYSATTGLVSWPLLNTMPIGTRLSNVSYTASLAAFAARSNISASNEAAQFVADNPSSVLIAAMAIEPAQPVPTMSPVMIALLAMLVLLLGFAAYRQRARG